jgi:hypothetical protein
MVFTEEYTKYLYGLYSSVSLSLPRDQEDDDEYDNDDDDDDEDDKEDDEVLLIQWK